MKNELAAELDFDLGRRIALLAVAVAVVVADMVSFTTGAASASDARIGLGLGAMVVILALCRWDASAVGLHLRPRPSLRYWVVVVLVLAAASVALIAAAGVWFWHRDEPVPRGFFADTASMWQTFSRSVLRAPISEELVYRLALCFPLVVCLGPWPAILISGGVFAYLHQVYGNFAPNHVAAGLIMSWSYVRSGCLWLPIALHALGNLQVFLLNVALWWWHQA